MTTLETKKAIGTLLQFHRSLILTGGVSPNSSQFLELNCQQKMILDHFGLPHTARNKNLCFRYPLSLSSERRKNWEEEYHYAFLSLLRFGFGTNDGGRLIEIRCKRVTYCYIEDKVDIVYQNLSERAKEYLNER